MMLQSKPALLIAVGLDFYVSENEMQHLVAFAQKGNEVFIFSRFLDQKLQRLLHLKIRNNQEEEMVLTPFNNGSNNLQSLSIAPNIQGKYGYQGKSLKAILVPQIDSSAEISTAHFDEEEYDEEEAEALTTVPDTLGYFKGSPNMLRYNVGNGHITVHSAPLAMSNYFLLQNQNYEYLQAIWNTLPAGVGHIYWNDYYKRTMKTADLGVLLAYPATRWAFILAIFTLLMYLLFESKRKQRIVAEIPPLENSSVSFAETVGRLYYNKGNHTNLAEKMVQHFLEWVRTHYFISTNKLDKTFSDRLMMKSGLSPGVVSSMMDIIREVQVERKPMSEADLYHLHQTIQQFYKKSQ